MTDYKTSLNLPATEFPMKASLPAREPDTLTFWNEQRLYHKILEKNADKPPFVIHDGPPFSNGNIHMGTALNKSIKDFINKYKAMRGFYTPYVPGWDNHGLSIESAIIKQTKLNRNSMTIPEFRDHCREFAQKFIDLQRESFKRLGVIGDWDNPYTTMDPAFEATEIKVFGDLYKNGYIYKSLKPVHWCPHDETALAEAEIEYSDDESDSLYVKFPVKDGRGIIGSDTFFVIWTTTPWTLPGNVAIALHPRVEYSHIAANGEKYIMATALIEQVMKAANIQEYSVLGTFAGSQLEYITAQHPFLDRESLVVNADYVTTESGTGCVHTAPGFGMDDYFTYLKYPDRLAVVVPVDDRGFQTAEAGEFAGMFYSKSNQAILDRLAADGFLLASAKFMHSYPHCWRCRNPIIFRATPQWFCSVASFKDEAIRACAEVTWTPSWGYERMISMIRERTDWCISRQRHWGLPIPVFYCKDCGEIICDDATIANVSQIFSQNGSSAWFAMTAKELLPDGYCCPVCGKSDFDKETDTLDCWFDSGSTHFHVIGSQNTPVDLYMEGGDQFRGWFQSSLLTAIGSGKSHAPYKAVLTNGWVVDGEGKAMHKSLGNSILAEDVINQYGADILRLWVASSDYRVDVRASQNILKQLSESYRKIRNTMRILLANLGTADTDFDPKTDMVALDELEPIDKWALSTLNSLLAASVKAYDDFEFHIVYHDILNFCSVELSKLYIDITKDRLYCEKKSSKSRRSAQTAMYIILDALIRVTAPILSYTAEEAWGYLSKATQQTSVFLADYPLPKAQYEFTAEREKYDALFAFRDEFVTRPLEEARVNKLIGKSLDADVTIVADDQTYALLASANDLAATFIVNSVTLVKGDTEVIVEPAKGEKCVRCWKSYQNCGTDDEGQPLCDRCKAALC